MDRFATLVRLVAVSVGLIVASGFVLFALDESDKSSRGQVSKIDNALNAPNPTRQQELLRQREHGDVHETIDDANDFLLKPFAPIVDSSNSTWARRGVPTLLALLVYGLGGLLLANFLPKSHTKQRDWRGVPTSRPS